MPKRPISIYLTMLRETIRWLTFIVDDPDAPIEVYQAALTCRETLREEELKYSLRASIETSRPRLVP